MHGGDLDHDSVEDRCRLCHRYSAPFWSASSALVPLSANDPQFVNMAALAAFNVSG
jgi:hypothetical protein